MEIINRNESKFGDLEIIQSKTHKTIDFTEIKNINEDMADKEVTVRGRIHNSRVKGNLAFVIIRDGINTLQSIAFKSEEVPKEMLNYIKSITKESIIDIVGNLKKTQKEVESCTVKTMELEIKKIFVVSRADVNLPFQLEDACRKIDSFDEEEPKVEEPVEESKEENKNKKKNKKKEKKEKKENTMPTVSLKNRLDNRILDLRTPINQSIFKVQSKVCQLFREFLYKNDFMEIHTPKLLAGSSEGGANVFNFNFFGRQGCLAQSPQLYKQMSIMGDFKRVFEIGPVFRAENSFTKRHLCEFTGLDLEMEIKESYLEVLEMVGNLFNYIFRGLLEQMKQELSIVNGTYPFEEFLFLDKPLIITFAEGVQLLKENGVEQSVNEDLDTVNEKFLGKLVRDKYKTDFYILHKYPESARPFYTMLDSEDKNFTCSYDVFMRGQEIISGAQRIHDPKLLEERAIVKGLKVETIKGYLDSFKFGAFPHGGVGIGMERVVMLFMGLTSVKLCSMYPRDPKRLTP